MNFNNALVESSSSNTSNSLSDISYSTFNPEQILYIDSAVKDYQVLIDSLEQPTEVVILNSQQDGLVQITESLQQYQERRLKFRFLNNQNN